MEVFLFMVIAIVVIWNGLLSWWACYFNKEYVGFVALYQANKEVQKRLGNEVIGYIKQLQVRFDGAVDIIGSMNQDIENIDLRLRDLEDFEDKQVVHNVNYEQDLMSICDEIQFLEDDGQTCVDKISTDMRYLFNASNRHECVLGECQEDQKKLSTELDLTKAWTDAAGNALHDLNRRLEKLEKQPAPRKR